MNKNTSSATTPVTDEPDYFVFADYGDGRYHLYRQGLTAREAVGAMTRLEAALDSGMYGTASADFGRLSNPDDLSIAHQMGIV